MGVGLRELDAGRETLEVAPHLIEGVENLVHPGKRLSGAQARAATADANPASTTIAIAAYRFFTSDSLISLPRSRVPARLGFVALHWGVRVYAALAAFARCRRTVYPISPKRPSSGQLRQVRPRRRDRRSDRPGRCQPRGALERSAW